MKKLNTIQKRENLNEVFAVDEKGAGGANHEYHIKCGRFNNTHVIQFQNGARKEPNSIHGILDTDLLEIIRDRLKGFQGGGFATDYNEKALEHIELSLMYMNRRVEDRIERNVLGSYKK